MHEQLAFNQENQDPDWKKLSLYGMLIMQREMKMKKFPGYVL